MAMQNSMEKELGFRMVVDEGVRHVVVGADVDALDVVGAEVVLEDQLEHLGHARMGQRARGVRLDGIYFCPDP